MALIVNNIQTEGYADLSRFVLPGSTITKTLNGNVKLTTQNTSVIASGDVTGFTLDMPSATTLRQGQVFHIYNSSSTSLQVRYNDGTNLALIAQNSAGYFYLESIPTTNGVWRVYQMFTDAVIATGIVNYYTTSSTPFSTTSLTDVPVTGFSITPQAGTYAVWFNSRMQNATGSPTNNWSIYRGGVEVTDSSRGARFGAANTDFGTSTQTISQVDGFQAFDVRVRCSSSTLTVFDRSLLLIRLGT